MGIYKKAPGKYYVVVEGARRPDGRRRQLTRIVNGTREQAKAVRKQLETDAGTAQSGEGTVGQMLDLWLELADLSPASASTSRWYVEKYLRPALGHITLQKLDTVTIDRAYKRLSAVGGKDGGPLAPATVQRAHGILHRACVSAVRWGMLSSNPAHGASPPSSSDQKDRAPTAGQVRNVIDVARGSDPDLATFVALAAATGARRGEVCGIQWEDITGRILVIRRSVSTVDGVTYAKSTKTGRERDVPLDRSTMRELARYRRRRAGTFGRRPSGFVFTRTIDGSAPLLPGEITHRFVAVRKQAGEQFRLHDIRHFTGSELIGAGVPVTTVAKRLGHARASTTTDRYGSPVSSLDSVAADKIENILNLG